MQQLYFITNTEMYGQLKKKKKTTQKNKENNKSHLFLTRFWYAGFCTNTQSL